MAASQEFFVNLGMRNQQILQACAENVSQLPVGASGRIVFLTTQDGNFRSGYYYHNGTSWVRVSTTSEADAILSKVTSLEESIGSDEGGGTTILSRISALETTVGDIDGGLVRDVSDNTASINGLTTDLAAVKATADAASALSLSNQAAIGADTTSGTVKFRIATLESEMDAAQNDISDLKDYQASSSSDISALKTTVGDATSGLVKDNTTNKQDIASLKSSVNTLTTDLGQEASLRESADSALSARVTAIEGAGYITKDVSDLTNYYKKSETYTQTQIDDKVSAAVSSVYKIKGTITSAQLAALTTKVNGDVYNISDAFTLDGVKYPAGTNVVWVADENKWDVLSGLGDFHLYAKTEDVTSAIATAKSEAISAAGTNTDNKLLSYVPKTTTVNGHVLSSNVTVTKSDVGLGNCNNTSDMDKPVSTAQKAALDTKADAVSTGAGTWTGKITVNSQGIVTKGVNLTASDIPTLTASKISDFATASVSAGKAIFSGVSLTVSDSWQDVGTTTISGYPSAITAYDSDGVVVGVAFKYNSTTSRVQYMVNEAFVATVVVSL